MKASELKAGRTFGVTFQHGDEFITAETGQRIAFAQAVPEARYHLQQQFIAGAMAQTVIDLLETVEIDEQHGADAASPPYGFQRMGEAGLEDKPVGQAGQGICDRQLFLLECLGEQRLGPAQFQQAPTSG